MKIFVELNNLSRSPVTKSFFLNVAKLTLKAVNFNFLAGKKISVNFALVSEQEMKRLNCVYRKENGITDVLSFSEYGKTDEIGKEKSRNVFLGEILLCYNFIVASSKKNKLHPKKKLVNVSSHGILHLLGMRHGKTMFALQKEVLRKLNGGNN